MRRKLLIKSSIVAALGLFTLAGSAPASNPAAGCPFVECIAHCPFDWGDFCSSHGCSTSNINCGDLFNCSGPEHDLMYCGSEPE
jgi:hypothetical protein